MVTSLPINNTPVLLPNAEVPRSFASKPENEAPKDVIHQLPKRVPQVLNLEEVELMKQRLDRRTQTDEANQEGLELKNRRAITAYQSHAATAERDLVSEVLGIDDYA